MFERKCPKCNESIFYNYKYNFDIANRKKSQCKKCSGKLIASKRDLSKENNPFYGKKHSKETIDKLIKASTGKSPSKETREKLRQALLGRKISEETKDKIRKAQTGRVKSIEEKDKLRKNFFLIKDLMIGGRGWSGWYKNWFFRSLKELSYIIGFVEKNNLSWISGECQELLIKYTDKNGEIKNYFPDFLVNNSELIEIKPLRLHNLDVVVRKKEAAEKFCKERGLVYKLIDYKKIPIREIKQLYDDGLIKFVNKYIERFENFYEKHKSKEIVKQ